MSKKFVFLILICFAIIVAGCSKKEEAESAGKSKAIEASIEDASYFIAEMDEGSASDEDTGLLAVEMKVKNLTDSGLDVFPSRSFKLYDGDQEIDANSDATYELGSETGSIGAKKSKNLKVAFTVEKDKKYDLAIRTMSAKGEEEEVKLKLDTSEYNQSFEKLEDPAKALTAYIETIYLDKENADYEKLVTADKAVLQDDAKKLFKEGLDRVFYDGVPDKEIDKFYSGFQSALSEKAELNTETVSNIGDKAVVNLEYTALPLNDMSDMVRDYQEEYRDKNGYDNDKANAYAMSKFDAMINKLEPKSGSDYKIKMIQKDGKWTIDSSDYNSESLVETFAKGSIY